MKRQTLSSLKDSMMKAFISAVNGNTRKNIQMVKSAIEPIVFEAIYSCPEMHSVRSGILKYDFGLPFDPTTEIASGVSKSIDVRFSAFKYIAGSIKGGSTVSVQPADHLNLLSLPSSVVITEKGASLPWLDWLLNYGDSIIIANFGVNYTSGGRSGGALMIEETGPFKVNPMFSGTVNDNFVTRALNSRIKDIENRIWQTILN